MCYRALTRLSQAKVRDAGNRVLIDRGNGSNLNDSGQQQVLTLQGEIEAATTAGPKVNSPADAQCFNNAVNTVPVAHALARMSKPMVIGAGNRVWNEGVVYDVDTVTAEGHEPVSVEDLEKQNATASRLDKMENSAGGLQSNNDTWKTIVPLTPTVDRTDLDPMVTVTGGCGPTNATTEQVGKGAGFKDVTVNGEGYKHDESLEWTNATTSKFENRPTIDKRAGQWKVVAAQKSEAQGVQNVKTGEDVEINIEGNHFDVMAIEFAASTCSKAWQCDAAAAAIE
ncbi:hypothetical protein A4A49_17315 [Nicotiana attenuata]|uniref:Uncharacterized protein n=1 Tax=Nicotiana attenuata TaxID=49451 RepID=A0A314KX61_NICAT|nr:hypothetical protein A4A49_17315 [Nicotiana attenuata]